MIESLGFLKNLVMTVVHDMVVCARQKVEAAPSVLLDDGRGGCPVRSRALDGIIALAQAVEMALEVRECSVCSPDHIDQSHELLIILEDRT